MYKAATIKDIARALDVSPSTVSRALRDSHEVGTETKQKVLEYARQINYHYNPAALSLRSRRSYSIGIMVADVANSFFSQTINGIESIAYERGYNVIITQSHDSYEREVINMEHLANRSVDGLLISMSAQTVDYAHVTRLHEQGLPIVFFDRILSDIDTFKVTTDNFRSAYNATEALIKKGYRNIAHLANAPQLSITTERLNGYKAALADNDIPFNENLLRHCYNGGRDEQEVEQAVNSILSAADKPDALFIASDRISTACIRALNQIKGADELAIIGFSNSDVVDLLSPRISYIRQRAFEMGQIAIEMLIKLIESKYPVYEFETKLLEAEVYWQK
ncbi:LacI family DNA-binding transcriptional regulator [Mucilaginibacter gynuensis]|uniref:LacI family DNA-binding transcriptional regulator n=1 Tax=Mucilaginibacter gynuensis TaxID=1302236 RepID=A0ABP8GUN6_9SPHI